MSGLAAITSYGTIRSQIYEKKYQKLPSSSAQ
jgi:hypothetical protein